MSVIRRLLSVTLFPFILGLLSASACYVIAGPSLGLFLGGLLLVSFLVPPIAMSEVSVLNRLLGVLILVLTIIGIWLVATLRSETKLVEWAGASLTLLSYAVALAGFASGFRLVHFSPIVSAALTVILALAWLTWPIYMSRTWDGQNSEAGVARLILFHPGMAINAQVSKLGAWTGQSVAYHLTDLQQNVMYSLPHNYWPCVLFNSIVGGALLGLSWWLEGRGVAVKTCPSIVQIDPSATKNSPA
jgi:hypothetical protein